MDGSFVFDVSVFIEGASAGGSFLSFFGAESFAFLVIRHSEMKV
jgi:hypothetical protein